MAVVIDRCLKKFKSFLIFKCLLNLPYGESLTAFLGARSTLVYAPGSKWWEYFLEFLSKWFSILTIYFSTQMFNILYYYTFVWLRTYWFGMPATKTPTDFWVYQEIIWETRPQFIIETGSYQGGSALFFASICDLIGEGKVVTIDVDDTASRTLSHHRITTIVGSSVSDDVVSEIRRIVGSQTAMVSLDSDHTKDHVLREMVLYSEFVSPGNYLVVEDTGLRGPGPGKAVKEFLRQRKDFIQDRSREKFLLTNSRGGYLKKKES